ncbi:MAG: hypothetical protein EXR50_00760, partial [Dehalococcoidia bacterium]|nr:hypothetical protein [Dehalococcoidia bacterium]
MFDSARKTIQSIRTYISPATLDLDSSSAIKSQRPGGAVETKYWSSQTAEGWTERSPIARGGPVGIAVYPPERPPDLVKEASAPDGFTTPTTPSEHLIQKTFEIMPGAFTWLVIAAIFVLPFFAPWPLSVGVLLFSVYWLARSVSSAVHSIIGVRKLRKWAGTNWWERYLEADEIGTAQVPWEDVHHIVIIPNYKESEIKLSLTLSRLAESELAETHLTVVLAMEAAEEGCIEKAMYLQRIFKDSFANIFYTVHPQSLPGEVKGKSSNEAWAAVRIKKKLVNEMGFSLETLTVTSCDADSLIHKDYFSCLTYMFSTDPARHRKFWQAPIFLYNNIWSVPMPVRVVSILSGLNFLSDLCKGNSIVFPQSTYTLSLKMADEVGYWDVDVIPEDWHMFLKCLFYYGGEVHTEPVFLPVNADAVQSTSYVRSLIVRYQQAKRHAWGAIDIPYAVRRTVATKAFFNWRIARHLWALGENHLVWSTHWFLLALGGSVPSRLAPSMLEDPFLAMVPTIMSWLLTLCLLPLVVMI